MLHLMCQITKRPWEQIHSCKEFLLAAAIEKEWQIYGVINIQRSCSPISFAWHQFISQMLPGAQQSIFLEEWTSEYSWAHTPTDKHISTCNTSTDLKGKSFKKMKPQIFISNSKPVPL